MSEENCKKMAYIKNNNKHTCYGIYFKMLFHMLNVFGHHIYVYRLSKKILENVT